jgi:hypothetical protein
MDPTSDADVVTFESCSADGMDLDAFGKEISLLLPLSTMTETG